MKHKFRAWDRENKRWITPEIENNEESELRLDIWGNLYFKKPWFEQESGVVTTVSGKNMFDLSQSTWLKDKNGVEIFEGDILKHIDFESNECAVNVVYMKHGSLVFDVKIDGGVYTVPVYSIHPEASRGYEDILEVIGNIYENPELLEVAE